MSDMDAIILVLLICMFLLVAIVVGLVIMCEHLSDIKDDLHSQKLHVVDIEDSLYRKDKREFMESIFEKERGGNKRDGY